VRVKKFIARHPAYDAQIPQIYSVRNAILFLPPQSDAKLLQMPLQHGYNYNIT